MPSRCRHIVACPLAVLVAACAHVSSHGHADGDHHNLANSFTLAMTRTIAFFDKYVEGE